MNGQDLWRSMSRPRHVHPAEHTVDRMWTLRTLNPKP